MISYQGWTPGEPKFFIFIVFDFFVVINHVWMHWHYLSLFPKQVVVSHHWCDVSRGKKKRTATRHHWNLTPNSRWQKCWEGGGAFLASATPRKKTLLPSGKLKVMPSDSCRNDSLNWTMRVCVCMWMCGKKFSGDDVTLVWVINVSVGLGILPRDPFIPPLCEHLESGPTNGGVSSESSYPLRPLD